MSGRMRGYLVWAALLAPAALFLALLFLPLFFLVSPIVVAALLVLLASQLYCPHRVPTWLEGSYPGRIAEIGVSCVRLLRREAPRVRPELNKTPAPTLPVEKLLGEVTELEQLVLLERAGEFTRLQKELRKFIEVDPVRTFAHPYVKEWLGHRWRILFVQEACKDEKALEAATTHSWLGPSDSRPPEQRVAERFLKGSGRKDWKFALPNVDDQRTAVMPLGELPDLSVPGSAALVFCPGLLNGLLLVRAFDPALKSIEAATKGRVLRADAHPLRGCDANAADLLSAFDGGAALRADLSRVESTAGQSPPPPPQKYIVVCYSKGMPDLLTFLTKHPEWQQRVSCVFSWAGAIGGSAVADQAWGMIRGWDVETVTERIGEIIDMLCPIINLRKGPLTRGKEINIKDAVRDLTEEYRTEWLEHHEQELRGMNIPVFCITGATSYQDVPFFQANGYMLLSMSDANNDMQLVTKSALLDVPMATHVAMVNGTHWDMSYGTFPSSMTLGSRNLAHPFPKEAALKAMLMLAHELGLTGC